MAGTIDTKKTIKRPIPKNGVIKKKIKLIKIDSGSVITDVLKKRWELGKLLGQGGFGQVYEAKCLDENYKDLNKFSCEFAIKLEPSTNGPLFTEIAFYQRLCQIKNIEEYVKKNKLSYLAIPYYITSGISQLNGNNFRFLVFPKLGVDVETIWKSLDNKFSVVTLCHIGLKMIDALAYIHNFGYTHSDIKGSNILGDFNLPKLCGKIYLTDFGLASQYVDSTVTHIHKRYKEIPKQKHNGTIELTSCDAHRGVVPSRRSDIEILGYLLVRLFVSELPWECYKNDPEKVAQLKLKFSENFSTELSQMITPNNPNNKRFLQAIQQYFTIVYQLDYDEKPNYDQIKIILRKMITIKLSRNLKQHIDFMQLE